MTTGGNARARRTAVREITPCLTFNGQAEEAVNFYTSAFSNSRIVSLVRSGTDGPVALGKVLHAVFELNGRTFTAFDGGPSFRFTEGFSLVATCETQDELDAVWQSLCQGGTAGPCGWLTDQFGVSWQIIPAALGEMIGNPEGGNVEQVMDALLTMGKLDIATLRHAYAQPSAERGAVATQQQGA